MQFKRRRKGNPKDETVYSEKLEKNDRELSSASLSQLLAHSNDVVIRKININGNEALPVTMVFIDGLVDTSLIDEAVLKPLLQEVKLSQSKSIEEIIQRIESGAIYHASQTTRDKLSDCINDIMDGFVALIFDQVKKAVTFEIKGFETRSISEPTSENVIKGAKDSFVENHRTNTATIRRKIKSHNLVIEETKVGRQTFTRIAIVYIKGLTNTSIVDDVKKRLDKIDVDGVITTGKIEEGIIDHKYSPFPQILYTERPDRFSANIIEGRVGLIVDGLPITLIMPVTFSTFLQAPEDYSQNFIVSSAIRSLRFLLILITLFLPGFYVSITTFHHEMIPTELALAIAASKEGVPFPSFIEVIAMLVAFEVLVEAGLRLPKNIGQAVSIVGAVVVGNAAVDARLISPSVVVVIATTAIASFTMPNQDFSNALRLWRFIFVVMSSVIGLFGLSLGGIILLNHLANMTVFDVPYLAPFVGEENREMKDTLFRFPFSSQFKRPVALKTKNKIRYGKGGEQNT